MPEEIGIPLTAALNGGLRFTELLIGGEKHYVADLDAQNIAVTDAAAAADMIPIFKDGELRLVPVSTLVNASRQRIVYTYKWMQTLSGVIDAGLASGWQLPIPKVAGATNRIKRIKIAGAETAAGAIGNTIVGTSNAAWDQGGDEATDQIAYNQTSSNGTLCDVLMDGDEAFVYIKQGAEHGGLTVQIEVEVDRA